MITRTLLGACLAAVTLLGGVATTTLRAQTHTAVSAPAAPVPPEQAKAKENAQLAALAWLTLVDGGKYPESWGASASLFQKAVNQETWVNAITGLRPTLGEVVTRTLKGATFMKSLPGAPDGEYVVIQFNTDFTKKKGAVETVTPMREADGSWKVSGYFIK